jgi:hypothetical protein
MQIDKNEKFSINNLMVKEYLVKNGAKLKESSFFPVKANEIKQLKAVKNLK